MAGLWPGQLCFSGCGQGGVLQVLLCQRCLLAEAAEVEEVLLLLHVGGDRGVCLGMLAVLQVCPAEGCLPHLG